ncbi:MAG TPA: hypothetical protein PK857_03080 [Hyphomicrobium sp.]|nr:hypothetical protein [Hyphomicrobium sp.]HRO50585.1 hypothetical protein [Hyphomicrobium sp.]
MRIKAKAIDPVHGACSRSEAQALDGIIARFPSPKRAAIRRLALTSPRVADLAVTFPAALHALASRRGAPKRRTEALALVHAGAQLRDVAAALDLPLWLRRLPPEAFSGPLGTFPRSDIFARRIVNHLPTASDHCAFWLQSVLFGAQAADETFALWLAQQRVFLEPGNPEDLFAVTAAYAAISTGPPSRAKTLIVVPWRPEMALDTAVCAAKSWFNRMRLVMQLGEGALTDPWLGAGEARGYDFVPLLDEGAILAEAAAMQNCADQYADRLARDKCRLFSIRRRGVRIATLEIGPHPREAGVLAIAQLKARHNLPTTAEVWQAAHTWLGTQKSIKRATIGATPDRPLYSDVWKRLLADYRSRKDGAPWLPEHASKDTLAAIENGIGELARRAGITSWLFT